MSAFAAFVLAWLPSVGCITHLKRGKRSKRAKFAWACLLTIPVVGPIVYGLTQEIESGRANWLRGALVLFTGARITLPLLASLSTHVCPAATLVDGAVVGPFWDTMLVEYRYVVDGVIYAGDQYAFIPPEEYLSESELMDLQGGTEIYPVCFVSPWDDSSSVLVRELPLRAFTWRVFWLLLAGGIYFVRW